MHIRNSARSIYINALRDCVARIDCLFLRSCVCVPLLFCVHVPSLTPILPPQRRLLVSATDRHIFVHDERPIEEQVLYMTTSSAEGTEYLVISVSEKLSSLACAMSNGRIDLWNLDQAMRDVPVQGYHSDVITAMLFIDAQHILLSADDSGTIMAWFVRPSRWKGQLAFELHTPITKKEGATTTTNESTPASSSTFDPNNADPIRRVTGLSSVPGISSMGFHSPSGMLFCGHRNGAIQVWDLKPLLDFLTCVSSDSSASWFVTPSTTGSRLTSTLPSAAPSRPRTTLGEASRTSTRTATFNQGESDGSMVLSKNGLDTALMPMTTGLPIRDQLQLMASALRPCNTILAYDTSVSTLHVVLDPPALLSTTTEHVAHVWTLQGEPMGVLDSVQGLARGYAASSGLSIKGPQPLWNFTVNVAAREQRDRATTHIVLQDLESMAQKTIEATEAAAAAAAASSSQTPVATRIRRHSRPLSSISSTSSSASGTNDSNRMLAMNISLTPNATSVDTPPAPSSSSSISLPSLATPVKSAHSTSRPTLPSIPTTATKTPVRSSRRMQQQPNTPHVTDATATPSNDDKNAITASMASMAIQDSSSSSSSALSSSPSTSSLTSSPAGPFFLSTPMSPIDNYQTVTKGILSPATRGATSNTLVAGSPSHSPPQRGSTVVSSQ